MITITTNKWVATEKCIVTGRDAEYHHIHTRKARPDLSEKTWNKIPVSREIHSSFHAKGTAFMANKYPPIKYWLIQNGWRYDSFVKKWTHEGARNGNV
jgi:hypothetical protein